jgi:uncharacterized protein YdiU (UPF0061 family)
MKFDNSYASLPGNFFKPAQALPLPNPELIVINEELFSELNFDFKKYSKDELAKIFSGQNLLEGSHPIALAYAGHQFGHFVPSLGDGRALLLGEVLSKNNQRFDLQLKGSGPTFFSRRGDGKSALGPVLREYILSESMHSLMIPTTRALAAVKTNEWIHREEAVPAGIFCRLGLSHIRIGTFQYFAARNEIDSLKILFDYTINRHFSELLPLKTNEKVERFFLKVIENQTTLVSLWMSHGFIHGVMNTDNMSIALQTIDYGPCAFMDTFNPNQVYSYIDRNGRYAYSNQPKILVWNLSRLADCLIPLFELNENEAIEVLNNCLRNVSDIFNRKFQKMIFRKLGLEDHEENKILIQYWFDYLEESKLDFTLSFRNLSMLLKQDVSFFPQTEKFNLFFELWRQKVIHYNLDSINPIFIPRNHVIESMINKAYQGDLTDFHELIRFLKNPFIEFEKNHSFYRPPEAHEIIKNTFCGT